MVSTKVLVYCGRSSRAHSHWPLQMVIVTERVFASLANVLTDFVGLPRDVQRMNEDIQMSDLERKHGLLQVWRNSATRTGQPCVSQPMSAHYESKSRRRSVSHAEQVADTLQFLRGDCNLVHRAICPESIIVVGGTWKLASMGWCATRLTQQPHMRCRSGGSRFSTLAGMLVI